MQPCLIDSIYNDTHRHSKHALWYLESCQLLTTTRQQTNTDTDKRGRVRMGEIGCARLRMFTHRPLERPPRPTRMESPRGSLAPVPRPTAAPAPIIGLAPEQRSTEQATITAHRPSEKDTDQPPREQEGRPPPTTNDHRRPPQTATTDHKRPSAEPSRPDQHQHTRTTANKAIQLLLIIRCL